MVIPAFVFDPVTGFANTTSFPNPSSGTAARAQLMVPLDQISVWINALKAILEATTDGASGADAIAATAIADVTGGTVQAILEDLKTQLDGITLGEVADGSITFAKCESGISIPYGGTTTGLANTYVLALPAITSYAEGFAVAFKCNIDSTGASTLNVNALGAKSIKKGNGAAIASGTLQADSIYTVRYNGTNFILQGEGGGGGTATVSDLLSGITASADAGDLIGEMPNNAGDVAAVSSHADGTSIHVIPATGYCDGADDAAVITDADFVAANIANGISIFGVAGSALVATGNAAVGDVLSPKTFSNTTGVGRTGTMPNRGAVEITPSAVQQTIEAGYHNGSGHVHAALISVGDAAVTDVLATKTFSNGTAVNQTGTMTNRGAVNYTPGTSNQSVAAGYHNGSGVVSGDADLVAANIKSGVNIFGVAGSYVTLIKSIQYGTVETSATVNAVVVANSILINTGFTMADDSPDKLNRITLTNTTTVTQTGAGMCSFVLIEFEPGVIKSKQSGSISLDSATSNTATISSVSTTKSIVLKMGQASTTSGSSLGGHLAMVTLTNATTVTATCLGSETDNNVYFDVIEFN